MECECPTKTPLIRHSIHRKRAVSNVVSVNKNVNKRVYSLVGIPKIASQFSCSCRQTMNHLGARLTSYS